VYLDLGRVEVMARVSLNHHDLGILWKPPYRVDLTRVVHAGGLGRGLKFKLERTVRG